MYKFKNWINIIITLAIFYFVFSVSNVFAIGTITDTIIYPDLDISIFSPYKIKSTISGSPTSVSVNISGINGNLTNNAYWNYYTDGTPNPESRTKTMTYDLIEEKWISENIYPDDIYPEIFFAPSSITWNNSPSNIITRRSNYHIFHFDNNFTMAASSSLFIELNTLAKASNSQPLSIYLVAKDQASTYFTSDWRNKVQTELVGTIFNSDSFHHTHTANSSHRLIALATNDDGTIGTKHLDVNGDFWIVLYSNSPNNNLGWDLRYQNSSLCDNNNEWYIGSTSGWTMNHQSGCPDVHTHIARRGPTYIDGARAVITANFSDGSTVSTSTFSFGELPNLAPNPTSFIVPVSAGVYDGDELQIQWATSTDPNGDPLTYNIYISPNGISTTTLVSTTTDTHFTWDISLVDNGNYYLSGEVCDEELCTDFTLINTFTIQKTEPVYSLTNISILSSNTNNSLAKSGDQITLTFDSTGDISTSLNISLYSGGSLIFGTPDISNVENSWTLTYSIKEEDTDGSIDFVISADNLDLQYSNTTNDSYVLVDKTAPSISGLSNDLNATKSKTWSWDSDDNSDTYRFIINQNTTHIFSEEEYTSTTSTSQTSGNGVYYLHVQAKDLAGNESEVTHVSAILDNTPPTITIIDSNPVSIYKDNSYYDPGATASDNIDGNITNNMVVTNNVDINTVGTYSVIYVVSDTAGNTSTSTRVVYVLEKPSSGSLRSEWNNNTNNNTDDDNIDDEVDNNNDDNENNSNPNWTNGKWVKTKDSSTIYFVDSNNNRHIYYNQDIWNSYFGNDFSFVKVISKEELASYRLTNNVPFNKGVLIKIPTIPKVYLVGDNSVIHWITSESVAKRLYGDNWNKLVYDIPDTLFGDYILGSPIE